MALSSGVSRLLSHIVILLALTPFSLAAVTLDELLRTFNVEMRENTGGSCNRDYDTTPMLPKVLAVFEDAWLLAALGLENPSLGLRSAHDSQAFIQLRGLLFLWFGVLVTEDGAFATLGDASAYAAVMGMRDVY